MRRGQARSRADDRPAATNIGQEGQQVAEAVFFIP